MILELVQACTIRDEPIHAVLELVHACSICNEPIHMDPELVQACTNLKRDSYMSPLQFIRFYNKCWGDTTTVSLPTLFFLQKNKHTRLTYFTIKVSKS